MKSLTFHQAFVSLIIFYSTSNYKAIKPFVKTNPQKTIHPINSGFCRFPYMRLQKTSHSFELWQMRSGMKIASESIINWNYRHPDSSEMFWFLWQTCLHRGPVRWIDTTWQGKQTLFFQVPATEGIESLGFERKFILPSFLYHESHEAFHGGQGSQGSSIWNSFPNNCPASLYKHGLSSLHLSFWC